MDRTAARLLAGRYRIDGLLGEGAMSTVSRARDELLGRAVAVKVLKAAYGHDGEFVQRFYTEARLAARIVDSRVVSMYDIVSDGGLHAIVMEYVEGRSLAEMLSQERRFAEPRAIDYARQIACALAAAHAQQIVHRDLQPANVLVNRQGLVKVADFWARKSDRSERSHAGDARCVARQRPLFLAGTSARARPRPASDLYSLGIMLYQFCAGEVPYNGDSPVAIALAHVGDAVPAIASLHAFMSPGLARIVHRLLQKDPQARFASAGDLDAALAELEIGPSSAGTPPAY